MSHELQLMEDELDKLMVQPRRNAMPTKKVKKASIPQKDESIDDKGVDWDDSA